MVNRSDSLAPDAVNRFMDSGYGGNWFVDNPVRDSLEKIEALLVPLGKKPASDTTTETYHRSLNQAQEYLTPLRDMGMTVRTETRPGQVDDFRDDFAVDYREEIAQSLSVYTVHADPEQRGADAVERVIAGDMTDAELGRFYGYPDAFVDAAEAGETVSPLAWYPAHGTPDEWYVPVCAGFGIPDDADAYEQAKAIADDRYDAVRALADREGVALDPHLDRLEDYFRGLHE